MRRQLMAAFVAAMVMTGAACSTGTGGTGASSANVADVVAGAGHTCVLLLNGKVGCMGSDTHGQLGDGTVGRARQAATISIVGGLTRASAIAAGDDHTCAIDQDLTVKCWGSDAFGQLGDGPASSVDRAAPVTVSGITDAIALAAGGRSTCALQATGTLSCWGDDAAGQLGDGTVASPAVNPAPVAVSGLLGVSSVIVGDAHACATVAGTLSCWGDDSSGQLGDGTVAAPASDPVPEAVTGLGAVSSATAGDDHTCAIDGVALACWGDDSSGQLGDGTIGSPASEPTPAAVVGVGPVSGPGRVTGVSAGGAHTCVSEDPAITKCWGSDLSGQLGDGTAAAPAATATPAVTDIQRARVTTGDAHTCVFEPKKLECFGDDASGQLGDGVVGYPIADAVPATVPGFTNPKSAKVALAATDLSHGADHRCVIEVGGALRCWGSDYTGQLGDGTLQSPAVSLVPSIVPGASGSLDVAAGGGHTCAVLPGGTVRCWGYDSVGQVGDGDAGLPDVVLTPVTVDGLSGAIAVTAGDRHSCALVVGGSVRCWGYDGDGQIGDGVITTPAANSSAVPVVGVSDAVSVSAGARHTCAVRATGSVVCWGADDVGQLGDGTVSSPAANPSPVTVVGITDAVAVSAGTSHTCAVRATGAVVCWGSDVSGALGDGTIAAPANRATPAAVPGISSATAVSAGVDHTCVADGGAVRCWGSDAFHQLGAGWATPGVASASPVTQAGFVDATVVAVGGSRTCVLDAASTVTCWGGGESWEIPYPEVAYLP
jgi:alpha-tubulin suppressor-like RCC1 family protein